MDFEIPTGNGTETLTAKFGTGAMRKICSRGGKHLGVNARGINSMEAYINRLADPEILIIVLEEVLAAGGNKVGGKDGLDAEALVDAYVDSGHNLSDLFDFIVQEFNKSFSPRNAAKLAEESAERRAAMDAAETARKRATLAKLRAEEAEAIAEEEAAIKREKEAKKKTK